MQQAIRMIDDYHVDWILQDGQNMVKQCTKTTHTHDPADSNYANSVQGIDAAGFEEKAQEAKKNCPVSQALAGTTITLDATLA